MSGGLKTFSTEPIIRQRFGNQQTLTLLISCRKQMARGTDRRNYKLLQTGYALKEC